VPFLICDNCHNAIEMEDERISAQLEEKARALGFTAQAQTLEVHGLCSDCSQKSARAVRTSR
jgi:Fur family zinc uptake transcriptional regulator